MKAQPGHSNFAPPESHPRLARLSDEDQVKVCNAFRTKSIGLRIATGFGIGVVALLVLPRLVWIISERSGVDVDATFGSRNVWTIFLSLFVFWVGPLLLTMFTVVIQRRYVVNKRLSALDAHVPCPTCLYSLAESSPAAVKVVCPECGTEVEIAAASVQTKL
jgi:hypothetical protein